MISSATFLYLEENQNKYGYISGDTYCISLKELVREGKLSKPIKDSRGKELDLELFVQANVVERREIDYKIVESCNENNTTPGIPNEPDLEPGTNSNAPQIEFTGSNYLSVTETSFDALDGVLISDDNTPRSEIKVTITGEVSLGIIGKYPIVYEAVDRDSNVTTKTRVVEVLKREYVFDYTGSYQEFKVQRDGTYQIELWGAGSLGSYTKGTIELHKDELFYVYVGQKSQRCDVYTQCGAAFNGGGAGGYFTYSSYSIRTLSGGGATDIRYFDTTPTISDLTWNSALGLRSRIMVAGGSGGIIYTEPVLSRYSGNGLIGGSGLITVGGVPGTGGTQISGGTSNYSAGSFGVGGSGYITWPSDPNNNEGSGGGGGYYGGGGGVGGAGVSTGGSNSNHGEGGGGSSYISGYLGCVAVTSKNDTTPKSGCSNGTNDITCSHHYSGKLFTSPVMKIGSDTGIPNYDGTGSLEIGTNRDGYAKITLLLD